MEVLVTGGAGFIGSHLVDALLDRGDRVTVIDDFSSGSKSNLGVSDRLRVFEFSLGTNLPDGLEPGVFDAVVHLAGLPSVAASWTRPIDAHHRTLTSTLSLIDACERLQIPRMIFASSAAVYGLPQELPIPETAECVPLSPYGLQKLTSEKYLSLFCRERGLRGISLRFFNVFGPRQRPDSAYSGAISIFAEALRKGEAVTVFGDGSQTRDFVYVADVIEAICSALLLPMSPGESLTFNIGTGQRRSLLDLIDALANAFAMPTPAIKFQEARAGDIPHSQPDISQAQLRLKFEPKTSLAQGLRRLIANR